MMSSIPSTEQWSDSPLIFGSYFVRSQKLVVTWVMLLRGFVTGLHDGVVEGGDVT